MKYLILILIIILLLRPRIRRSMSNDKNRNTASRPKPKEGTTITRIEEPKKKVLDADDAEIAHYEEVE